METKYSPDIPKTAEKTELEGIISKLVYRLDEVREDGPEYKLILRQLDGIRYGSELGGLLMEEYDAGGMRAVRHWASY
ncbi:hypothetical protein JQ636_22020 [Bradyrhizobium japonicum]|uniref:hypothetical protein n=1 Tax=Bradyrhizobium japonicum TaxID=375 RepID=UPI001BA861CF|nr:hypothetical protein [Bradyrhizobium japonicum]MBR0806236.1 hypothetical protein [Bradyrhizobium japonicum]